MNNTVRLRFWIIVIVVFVVYLVAQFGVGLYTDFLWFQQLELESVFLTRFWARIGVGLAIASPFVLLFWANAFMARRQSVRNVLFFSEETLVGQKFVAHDKVERHQPGPTKGVPGRVYARLVEKSRLSQVGGYRQGDGCQQAQAATAIENCSPAKNEAAQPPVGCQGVVKGVVGMALDKSPAKGQGHQHANGQQGEVAEGIGKNAPAASAGMASAGRG